MLTVGQKLPAFRLKATVSTELAEAFVEVNQDSYPDKWLIVFFYPRDFTFVCPTELKAFGDLSAAFQERDAQILAASTDTEYVHLAWRRSHADLHDLPFPMLADVKRELSSALGVLDPNEGVALRATFVVDPQRVIRFVTVNDFNVGRNPLEVMRVLDALQTDALCPCNWSVGDDTLKVA